MSEPRRPRRRISMWHWAGRWRIAPQLASLVVGTVAWEGLGRMLRFPFLPPLSQVLRAAMQLWLKGDIARNLTASVASLVIGYGLAVVLGISIGALMGRYRQVEYLLDIYLNVFLSSPTLIYVPVLFALFGVSRASQVAVVFLYAFFVIVANTMTGIRGADAILLEMAHSFGASERQLFWKVMFPAALPMILAGLRIGMARAVKGMINGEMFIALIGLGALIRTYGSRFEADKVLAILLFIVAVSWIGTGLVQVLDHRLTRWCP